MSISHFNCKELGPYNQLPRDWGTQGVCDLVGVLAHTPGPHSVDGIADAVLPAVAQRTRHGFSRGPSHSAIPPGVPTVRGVCGAAVAVHRAVLLPARPGYTGLSVGEGRPDIKVGELFRLCLSRSTVRFLCARRASLGRSPHVGAGRGRVRRGVRHRPLRNVSALGCSGELECKRMDERKRRRETETSENAAVARAPGYVIMATSSESNARSSREGVRGN